MTETDIIHSVIMSISDSNILPQKHFYENMDEAQFISVLDHYMLTRSSAVPRKMATFLSTVLDHIEGRPDMLFKGVQYVIGYVDVRNRHVRKNVVCLAGLLIDRLCASGVDSSSLLGSVLVRISERLFDREAAIRKEAVKILSPHQRHYINGKTNVKRIFKDLLRYDPSADVRVLLMHHLIASSCAIDRIRDRSVSVRQTFYKIVLPHISLRGLSVDRRCLIMEKSVLEREFNALHFLKNKIRDEYTFPDDLVVFAGDFMLINGDTLVDSDIDRRIEENSNHLMTVMHWLFEETGLAIHFFTPSYYEQLSLESTFVLFAFLTYIESRHGRDALEMVDLEYFTSILYIKVKEAIGRINDSGTGSVKDLHFVTLLFKLTNFYDIYDHKHSKYILSTIYKFFTIGLPHSHPVLSKLIQHGILLASSTDRGTFTNFLGSLITKNKNNHHVLFVLCKYVMMYVKPYDMMHDAIVNEIVMDRIGQADDSTLFEILFYYVVNKYDSTGSAYIDGDGSALIDILMDDRHFVPELAVDLYLIVKEKRDVIREKIIRYYNKELGSITDGNAGMTVLPLTKCYNKELDGNTDTITGTTVLPLTKCMLYEPSAFSPFFGKLVIVYFCTASDYVRQYMTVFVREYVVRNACMVINELFIITDSLSTAHAKVFIDQTVCWLKETVACTSTTKCMHIQELLFNLLIHFIKRSTAIHNSMLRETDKHILKTLRNDMSSLIHIFDFAVKRMSVDGTYAPKRIKQMLYCLGLIAKIGFAVKERICIGELSNQLMVYNDGMAISDDDIKEITTLLYD